MPPQLPPARLAQLPSRQLAGGLLIIEAATPISRMRGLAGLDDLPLEHALLLPRCRSVHTFGMRFAIDVVFLGGDGEAVRVAAGVPPRRLLACRRARATLETAAGQGERFVAARAAHAG